MSALNPAVPQILNSCW